VVPTVPELPADIRALKERVAAFLEQEVFPLEQRVAEKTAQLEMANRHKSEFLANMSHELRTPLNAVIGFSEVLREEMFGPLNAKQLEYVSDIHLSGQHLLSLINDILDLSKVEAGRMQLDVHAFDVRAAIDNCATLIRERALRGELRFSCETGPGTDFWRGDERKFKQVVINLLSNAVKYTVRGEASLTVRYRNQVAEFEVSDTGIGMDAPDLERIFEPFERGTAAAVLGYNYPDSKWYKNSFALLQKYGTRPQMNEGSWITKTWKGDGKPA